MKRDLLDEIAALVPVDEAAMLALRKRYGGGAVYIESARGAIHAAIRASDQPATVLARRWGLSLRAVQRVLQRSMKNSHM